MTPSKVRSTRSVGLPVKISPRSTVCGCVWRFTSASATSATAIILVRRSIASRGCWERVTARRCSFRVTQRGALAAALPAERGAAEPWDAAAARPQRSRARFPTHRARLGVGVQTSARAANAAEQFATSSQQLRGPHGDLARVKDLLATGALVTIAGTGGVGKTRLALAAATDVLNDMPDGAWFVDFASLSDSSLAASAVLTALGADQTADAPALETLVGYLKKRALLLVLDNCEHVIGDVAPVVAAVVAACPEVGILATSREALNVSGERVHRLSSLGDAESVALFAERARAVRPDFRGDVDDVATIEDICRRLDGIALAIELAAARMRSISLDELSQKLRLRILGGGARDRQPRQQTMHALIDWSYDLLSVDEQRLFRSVAIFAGGFTLDAATGVNAGESLDEWALLDLLTSLTDKSLVQADVTSSSQRYRLLEPLREYGRESWTPRALKNRPPKQTPRRRINGTGSSNRFANMGASGWTVRVKPPRSPGGTPNTFAPWPTARTSSGTRTPHRIGSGGCDRNSTIFARP